MKVLQCLGTRPNLVKFVNITGKDVVIWTDQHWDKNLMALHPGAFTMTLEYKGNKVSLGQMTEALELQLLVIKPDLVIVYGDTRSALAGALAADQLNIPLVHIEAGVRLNNLHRPEERIRRMIDQISDYLFCINERHYMNLENEGVKGKKFIVGDLHYDQYLRNRKHDGYVLATIHRSENTDTKEALECALSQLRRKEKVIFPVHPRTSKAMKTFNLHPPKNVEMVAPLSYTDMQDKMKSAKLVITDSGGVSREACFCGTPVEFIGRSEWEEEVRMFGDGTAGEKIRRILKGEFSREKY